MTGCSSGLGKALAVQLHKEQRDGVPLYSVYATARSLSALQSLSDMGIRTLSIDVTNANSVDLAVKTILEEAGTVDMLVNNAGISRIGPIAEQSLDEMEEVLQTNVVGVIRVTKAVLPTMMKQRSGCIVMIGSITCQLSTPYAGIYSASKSALLSLTDSMRLELSPWNISCIYVAAGSVKSSLSQNMLSYGSIEKYKAPESMYKDMYDGVLKRVKSSQVDSKVVSAEAAAEDIVRRVMKNNVHWFLTGGNALTYFVLGLIQRLSPYKGWPVHGNLKKMFGLLAYDNAF